MMNQQVLTSRGLAITSIRFDRDRDLIKTELDTDMYTSVQDLLQIYHGCCTITVQKYTLADE